VRGWRGEARGRRGRGADARAPQAASNRGEAQTAHWRKALSAVPWRYVQCAQHQEPPAAGAAPGPAGDAARAPGAPAPGAGAASGAGGITSRGEASALPGR
jgi:hypothetical protein